MATKSIERALEQAREHLRAGRMAEGEVACQAILRGAPGESEAHRMLGLLALSAGNTAMAERHLLSALDSRPGSAEVHNALCMLMASQGRYAEAEQAARRALEICPGFAEAHSNLGGALQGQNRLDEAVESFRTALVIRPDFAEAAYNLGFVLQAQQDWEGAARAYERTLALRPGQSEAEHNLGLVRQVQGRLKPAIEAYRRSLQADPKHARSAYNMGVALQHLNCLDEAIAAYRWALALQPHLVMAANNLGSALQDRGRLDEAIQAYQHALSVTPAFPEAENNLGNALKALGRLNEAIAAYRRALAMRPDYVEAESNLGLALQSAGRLEEATDAYRRALTIKKAYPEAENNLGNALLAQGDLEEALAAYRRALTLKPKYLAAFSNMLMCEQYRGGVTPDALACVHAEWDALHAEPLRAVWKPCNVDRDPERPLRLGFVSPDLRRHPVGFFLVRVLENLDPKSFEVVCYHSRADGDDLSARIAGVSKEWQPTLGLTHDALAEKIRADRIDILFDLSGHTCDHRLLVFAQKPAPIQVTWMGYVGTTGLEAIDYLIADRFHVPPGSEGPYREKVVRMPDGYICFDPPAEAPDVGPLPAPEQGHVTFGCFNNAAKLTPEVLALWAEILRRVPEARLRLVSPGLNGERTRKRIGDTFAEAGGDPARLDLRGTMLQPDLLAAYNTIDLALDPFPYSGGVTTCEALWMGVPVVTCPGATFASRHSFSHLSNIGLTETVAEDHRDYVDHAVRLANDLPQLSEIRAGLRDRMARSPLCDGPRFAGHFMSLWRDVWRQWCVA